MDLFQGNSMLCYYSSNFDYLLVIRNKFILIYEVISNTFILIYEVMLLYSELDAIMILMYLLIDGIY